MKRVNWLIGLMVFFGVAGCFDTVQETTIRDDGGGVFVSTTEMGKLFGMIKMLAGEKEEMKDLEKMKMDTLVHLKDIKDSLKNLSEAEKKLIEKGTLKMIMNVPDEIFTLSFSFPYSQPADMITIAGILKKSKQDIISDQVNKFMPGDKNESDTAGTAKEKNGLFGDQVGDGKTADVDDYYNYRFEKGKMSKKLNKEMYAKVENDKSMSMLKEMSQMGVPASLKTIINLPRAVKKAEGKGVKVSDDRKKITIEGSIDDFFEDPALFEYEIEY